MKEMVRPALKHRALTLLKFLGVFALFRYITRKQLRIICYHRGCLGDEWIFNPKLFCSSELMSRRLAWLHSQRYTPVSLDAAVQALRVHDDSRRLPVVITVDDGWYSSRACIIEPALKASFEVTLYLATEVMQRQIPVLDVTLHYILWKAGPMMLQAVGMPFLADGRYDLSDPRIRGGVVETLLTGLRASSENATDVQRAIQQFAQALGLSVEELALDSRRFSYLDAEELRTLHQRGCDVQLHGHGHLYPIDQPEALKQDIDQCRTAILEIGLPMPTHYCYPSGEFDAHAQTVLDGLEVESATTCHAGLVRVDSPPPLHLLPRFLDGEDVSQLEFEAEMSGVLQFARNLRGFFRA